MFGSIRNNRENSKGKQIPEGEETLAAMSDIRIAMVATRTVTKIPRTIGRVQTLAVLADAGVGCYVALCYLACLVSDLPIHHQRRLAAAVVQESVRRDVRC